MHRILSITLCVLVSILTTSGQKRDPNKPLVPAPKINAAKHIPKPTAPKGPRIPNPYQPLPPSINRILGRVRNPVTGDINFPVDTANPPTLYDSNSNPRGRIVDRNVKLNYGGLKQIKPTPEAAPQPAISVWGANLQNGQLASGSILLSQLPFPPPTMPALQPPTPARGRTIDYTITGGEQQSKTGIWGHFDNGRFIPYKVAKHVSQDGMNSTDYGWRDGGYVNLSYNVPGKNVGGISYDTFKVGTSFQRNMSVNPEIVPLYYAGKNGDVRQGHLTFVFGSVQTPTGVRSGWIPLEALQRTP